MGELIDSLIEITIAPETNQDVSEQLEPIIEGLVSISNGREINDPVIDFKELVDLYLMDEMMRAMRSGNIGEACHPRILNTMMVIGYLVIRSYTC